MPLVIPITAGLEYFGLIGLEAHKSIGLDRAVLLVDVSLFFVLALNRVYQSLEVLSYEMS